MRILRAFSIAFLTAIAGCIVALFVGDYLTRLAHVSDFEGGRGYMVVFLCGPVGILAGLMIGTIASVNTSRRGIEGFFIALGISILSVCIVGGLTMAIPYALSDKPPRIDGKWIELEFQLRTPATIKIPDQPDGYSVRVSLYTDNGQSRFAFIDWNKIARDADHVTISGTVPIETHSSGRSLLASVGNEPIASQFFELKLPASPGKENENWSDWITATQRADLSPIPETERFAIRYRIQPVGITAER